MTPSLSPTKATPAIASGHCCFVRTQGQTGDVRTQIPMEVCDTSLSRFTQSAWKHVLTSLSFSFTDMAQALRYISSLVGTMFISSAVLRSFTNGLATF